MFNSGVTFNNTGAMELESGTLTFNGSFHNQGIVQLSPGTTHRLAGGGSATGPIIAPPTAMVEWTGGTFTLGPGAQLDGEGLYRINGGNVTVNVTVNADVTVANLEMISGFSTLSGAGALTVGASMNWTAGIMSGAGRTIIEPGATLHLAVTNAVGLNGRMLENGGTVLWSGPGLIQITFATSTNRPGALFEAQSDARFEASGLNRFDNAGTFRKSGGTGTTTVRSGMTFHNHGVVDLRSGILAASGGYSSTTDALLVCALGGTTPGTDHGQLQVAGAVTLDGALRVDLANGFVPTTNDTFTVLTAGTRNGTFGSFLYPSNAVSMLMSNTANAVVVTVGEVFVVPQPVFLAPEIAGGSFLLQWSAVPGTVYRLEFSPVLFPLLWSELAGNITTTGSIASRLEPLTSSNRLYRVRVLP